MRDWRGCCWCGGARSRSQRTSREKRHKSEADAGLQASTTCLGWRPASMHGLIVEENAIVNVGTVF